MVTYQSTLQKTDTKLKVVENGQDKMCILS